jgi:hypothetical protein
LKKWLTDQWKIKLNIIWIPASNLAFAIYQVNFDKTFKCFEIFWNVELQLPYLLCFRVLWNRISGKNKIGNYKSLANAKASIQTYRVVTAVLLKNICMNENNHEWKRSLNLFIREIWKFINVWVPSAILFPFPKWSFI